MSIVLSGDPLAALAALPRVVASVDSARAAVDRLLTSRVVRRRSGEVSAESALRGAWAGAVLSGSGVDLAAMRAGDVADPIVQGALRVSAELGALATTWRRAPAQVLARLHVLAAADLVADPSTLGRPRTDWGTASGTKSGTDLGTNSGTDSGTALGKDPGADSGTESVTARRVTTLATTVARTRAPAVVVAAIVLGEILGLDAFSPSSTVVGYGAARLTLVEFGLDPRSLAVLEVGGLELRASTPDALAQYLGGSIDGLCGWVEHVAELVVLGAREASAICAALERG